MTRWAIFMHLRTTPAWLRLPRAERARIAEAAFGPALHDMPVRLRYFDAEAFSGRCTDVAMFETEDLQAYYFVVERLRDSPIFTTPYFEVVDVVTTIEDGYSAFEAAEAA